MIAERPGGAGPAIGPWLCDVVVLEGAPGSRSGTCSNFPNLVRYVVGSLGKVCEAMQSLFHAVQCDAISGVVPARCVASLLSVSATEATLVPCMPVIGQVTNCVVAGHAIIIAVRCRASYAAQILSSGAHVVWAPSIAEDRSVHQQRRLPAFVQYIAVHLFWLRCRAVPRAVSCCAVPSITVSAPVAVRCVGPGPPLAIVPPVALPTALLCVPMLIVAGCAGPVAAGAVLVPNDTLASVVVAPR